MTQDPRIALTWPKVDDTLVFLLPIANDVPLQRTSELYTRVLEGFTAVTAGSSAKSVAVELMERADFRRRYGKHLDADRAFAVEIRYPFLFWPPGRIAASTAIFRALEHV